MTKHSMDAIEAYLDGLEDAGIRACIVSPSDADTQTIIAVIDKRLSACHDAIEAAPRHWQLYDAIRNQAYYDAAAFIGALTHAKSLNKTHCIATLEVIEETGPFVPLEEDTYNE